MWSAKAFLTRQYIGTADLCLLVDHGQSVRVAVAEMFTNVSKLSEAFVFRVCKLGINICIGYFAIDDDF